MSTSTERSNLLPLLFLNNDWVYGPIDVACSDVMAGWNARLATIDSNGQPVPGNTLACHT